MRIEIVSVNVEDKGKYKVAAVKYKMGSKDYSKNVMSFGDGKAVFDVLTTNPAKHWEVTEDPNSKYRNWVKAEPASAPTSSGAANASPKSNYETPEERQARQVYIVRQSSLERAIQLFSLQGHKKVTEMDVIATADIFSNYVFKGMEEAAMAAVGADSLASKLADLEDDVPL